jgi:6-phosphogluconolactonase
MFSLLWTEREEGQMNKRLAVGAMMTSRFLWFLMVVGAFPPGVSATRAGDGRRYLVYVGTYTDHGSQGIYEYGFEPATGRWTSLGLAAETAEPSFLAVDPSQRFLYAGNEILSFRDQPAGAVSAFAIASETGKLSLRNQVSSRDQGPAYVTLDRSGHYVLVANYTLGSVAVFPILQDGGLGEASAFVRHQGSSIDPQRQQGPHAHAIAMAPDNRFAIVADLGLDELIVYPFDAGKGTLGDPQVVKSAPGSGPRHLSFGPRGKFLYVINELQSTVTVFSYQMAGGTLDSLQTISTLPAGFAAKNDAAEIELHPSGRFLYASNRGHDSIAVFAIDSATGRLRSVEYIPTQGKTPRNFAIDPSGSWLFAANQNSNDIVGFRIDAKSGRLTSVGQVTTVHSPACVLFVRLP